MTYPRPTTEEVRVTFSKIAEALAPSAGASASRRIQVASLDGFKTEPTSDELDRLEALYVEEGFRDVQAIPSQGVAGRGWGVSVFASGSPYQDGRP